VPSSGPDTHPAGEELLHLVVEVHRLSNNKGAISKLYVPEGWYEASPVLRTQKYLAPSHKVLLPRFVHPCFMELKKKVISRYARPYPEQAE
jgi:hypothetical protein